MSTYDPEHFFGYPGMVWYTAVVPTRGDELKEGDALDSLDHCGARTIRGIQVSAKASGYREVHFGGGFTVYEDGSSDSELLRDDVLYDVVDLESVVAPDGTPLLGGGETR